MSEARMPVFMLVDDVEGDTRHALRLDRVECAWALKEGGTAVRMMSGDLVRIAAPLEDFMTSIRVAHHK